MTPQDFVAKWRTTTLKERSAAQEHFLDICRLLNHPTPAEADPSGEKFTFEAGVTKQSGDKVGLMYGRKASLPGSTRVNTLT